MARWSEPKPLTRHDDPYHAWAYEVEQARHPNPRPGLCPVVLEIKSEKPTYESLMKAMLEFGENFLGFDGRDFNEAPDTQFRMTAYDRQHFKDSLQSTIHLSQDKKNSTAPDSFEEKTAYARLFLVYATEEFLFADENKPFWSDENALFRILFVGRAIRAPEITEVERGGGTIGEQADEVMLTVIDDSIAFLNQEFTGIDDKGKRISLFSEIWFQDKEMPQDGIITDGARLDAAGIADKLQHVGDRTEAELYTQRIEAGTNGYSVTPLDLSSPDHQPLAFPVSHGTHVASTALRSFRAHKEHVEKDGAAELRLRLFGVTLPSFATQDTSGSSVGSYLIAAIIQACRWNDELSRGKSGQVKPVPLVITCSYGFVAGPKDGTGRLDRVIEMVLRARNAQGKPTSLVVPMGNSLRDRIVAEQEIPVDQSLDLDWLVMADDRTPSFLELYAKGPRDVDFGVELIAPSGRIEKLQQSIKGLAPGHARYLMNGERPAASLSHWQPEPGSGWMRRAFVALGPTRTDKADIETVPDGCWKLRITNESGGPLQMLAMIQRDDAPGTYPVIGRQSYFDSARNWDETGKFQEKRHENKGNKPPITTRYTATTFASIDSEYVVVAGAGMGAAGDGEDQKPVRASPYSARGPRAVHQQRLPNPDFTALVDRSDVFRGRFAAATYSGTDIQMSGSSVAAPVVAGYLAACPDLIGKDHRLPENRANTGMGATIPPGCGCPDPEIPDPLSGNKPH